MHGGPERGAGSWEERVPDRLERVGRPRGAGGEGHRTRVGPSDADDRPSRTVPILRQVDLHGIQAQRPDQLAEVGERRARMKGLGGAVECPEIGGPLPGEIAHGLDQRRPRVGYGGARRGAKAKWDPRHFSPWRG